jgi:hypothetical protein
VFRLIALPLFPGADPVMPHVCSDAAMLKIRIVPAAYRFTILHPSRIDNHLQISSRPGTQGPKHILPRG